MAVGTSFTVAGRMPPPLHRAPSVRPDRTQGRRRPDILAPSLRCSAVLEVAEEVLLSGEQERGGGTEVGSSDCRESDP
ncbi:hypothetical protein GCM10027282_26310 [Frigoribacterium salinisoli]